MVKIDSKGKASYIREEDLEELSKAMGKTLTTERQSARNEVEESSDSPSVPEQTVELLKEISDLKVEKTTLSSKVEEYS